jgi:SAM-dependent methyltransferase
VGIAVQSCILLNRLIPARRKACNEQASYADHEYTSTVRKLGWYAGQVELRGATVLDAGCGHGGRTVYYAERGCREVIGVDAEPYNIERAAAFARKRQTRNVRFLRARLEHLPFAAATFDIVLLNDVVEHLVRPVLIDALRECGRVLKPGGRLCVDFPPWTAHHASHLPLGIPWCHLLFSTDTLVGVTQRISADARLVPQFLELNRITIQEFDALVHALGFRVIHYERRMIRNHAWLERIPGLRDYVTSEVTAVLSV